MAKSKRITYTLEQKTDLIKKYAKMINKGESRVKAAEKLGVSYITLKNWLGEIEVSEEENSEAKKITENTASKTTQKTETEAPSRDMVRAYTELISSIKNEVIEKAIAALRELQQPLKN